MRWEASKDDDEMMTNGSKVMVDIIRFLLLCLLCANGSFMEMRGLCS